MLFFHFLFPNLVGFIFDEFYFNGNKKLLRIFEIRLLLQSNVKVAKCERATVRNAHQDNKAKCNSRKPATKSGNKKKINGNRRKVEQISDVKLRVIAAKSRVNTISLLCAQVSRL